MAATVQHSVMLCAQPHRATREAPALGKVYIVHGVDTKSGTETTKRFEANSGAEAKSMAQAIGIEVRAVELQSTPGSTENDPYSGTPSPTYSTGPEGEVWSGTPSQWTNFWWFVSCILVLPIPFALWKWFTVRCTRYTLTTQRLQLETGVFSKHLEEIELYRIKDSELLRPFVQRIVGLGTVRVLSSDSTMPEMMVHSVANADGLRELIREHVEKVRKARGVRELDVN